MKKIDSLTASLSSREAILRDYKDFFDGLGCMLQEYHIEIQQDVLQLYTHLAKYLLACMEN